MRNETPVSGSGAVDHDAVLGAPSPEKGVFRKEGEYWTVGVGGKTVHLKDSKGLAYAAYLLRHPGTEFHVLDLAGGIASANYRDEADQPERGLGRGENELEKTGIHVGGLGDAGEVIDDKAKSAYRRRLSELSEELEEAKALGKAESADRLGAEIDALTRELSRAFGLGGRKRHAASASERARQTVTKTIRDAMGRIARSNAALGNIFSRSIKTGTFCSYQPDPHFPIKWEFGIRVPGQLPDAPKGASPGSDPMQSRPPVLSILPFATARRTPFVGRENESGVIRAAIDRAREGSGSLVMLAGGPGVGKTRLVNEMADYAARNGFACFSGRCYERDDPHPLMPFVEIMEAALAQASSVEQFRRILADSAAELAQIAPMLRRVFQDLPAPPELPTAQVRRYLFQGLFDFVARMSQASPLLLVLDDLHWADESTFAMVNFLANRIEHVPVVVLATYRDEELDIARPLNHALEELLRFGVHPIKLRGLPRSGVAQMLAGLSRRQPPEHLITLVFDETQGNPFFVEEVFSHFIEEGRIFDDAGNFRESSGSGDLTVPENVRLVLGRRLARLSDNAREVLTSAAVIGRSFSFMLLESVLVRADPDALFAGLEEAQRTGFITSSSEGPEAPFIFTHELVRQTLLAGISQPRQQRLHLKIAQALEKVHGVRIEEHAAEVAHHLLKGGPFAEPDKTSYYLSLAGQSLMKAGVLEDARRTLAAALAYQQDAARRAQTLAALASAERGLGDWNAVIARLQDCIGLYATIGDLRSVGRIVFDMVEGFVWTGHFDKAAEVTERGLTHLRSDESAYRARLLPISGLIHAGRGELSPAMRAFDEALALPAVTPFLGRVLAYRAFCHLSFLQLHQALEDSQKSAALTNERDSPWTHAVALALVMRSLYHLGKLDQALRIGTEVEPLARGAGHLAALSSCLSVQAWGEFGREPDLTILDRKIRDTVNFDRERGLSWFLAQSLTQMSHVKFFAGDWDSAGSIAEEARAAEPHGSFAILGTAMLVRLAGYSGDRNKVLELVEQTRSQLPTAGQANTIGSWSLLMGMVEALVMVGERGRAAELYPRVRELLGCSAVCMEFTCRFPETIAGIAAGAAGNWDAAEQHFGVALRQAMEVPHRLEEAEVRRFHAMMLMDRVAPGDCERARELLSKAIETYTRIGMRRHVALTQTLIG